jgi:hypothetical protein
VWLALGASAAALACFAGAAKASDPPPAVIDWRGPPECQEAPRVLSGMRRLLAGEHAGTGLVAHVKAERAGRRWHFGLTTEQGEHSTVRALDADSCGAAADAIAVILTLATNPSRAGEVGEETETSGPPVADAASTSPESPGAAPGAPDRDARGLPLLPEHPQDDEALDAGAGDDADSVRVPISVVATGASDTGTLPTTAFGFGGGLGVEAGHLRFEGLIAYWPTVNVENGGGTAGGAFTMVMADLRMCALAEASVFSFGPCAGAGLTWMRAAGTGVTTSLIAAATWGDFVGNLLLRARLSSVFSLRVSAGVSVPFSRPTFEVEQQAGVFATVHQPAPLAVQVAPGLEIHF